MRVGNDIINLNNVEKIERQGVKLIFRLVSGRDTEYTCENTAVAMAKFNKLAIMFDTLEKL